MTYYIFLYITRGSVRPPIWVGESLTLNYHIILYLLLIDNIYKKKKTYESIINKYTNVIDRYFINIDKENKINKLKFLDNYTEYEKGYYLSGLFEGDGNIYTRCFTIIFSLEDVILADYLCLYFKIGHITARYNNKKELTAVEWNIIKRKDQEVFINYINGKLFIKDIINIINIILIIY